MSTATTPKPSGYAKLLAQHVPKPIRTKAEYKRLLKLAERYTRPNLTKDEELFLDLIGGLIEAYEEEHFPMPDVPPDRMLAHLLEARKMSQAQFAREIGMSRQLVTDILKARRSITAEHAAAFAKFFGVGVAVFIPSA